MTGSLTLSSFYNNGTFKESVTITPGKEAKDRRMSMELQQFHTNSSVLCLRTWGNSQSPIEELVQFKVNSYNPMCQFFD